MIRLKNFNYCTLVVLSLWGGMSSALQFSLLDTVKKNYRNWLFTSKPLISSQDKLLNELPAWDYPCSYAINQSYIPSEFHLVEIKQENPSIIIDMKYTTDENRLRMPISFETKCLVARKVMDNLNKVQAELAEQGLSLKVFDAFRPVYIENILALNNACYPWDETRYVSFPQEFFLDRFTDEYRNQTEKKTLYQKIVALYESRWSEILTMPFSIRGAMVSVTLVAADRQELEMPTKFDDRGEKAHPEYQDLSEEIIAHRALLKDIMLKHGFKQGRTWYEFYDDEAESFPRLLYTHYTTAPNLNNPEYFREQSLVKDYFLKTSRIINQIVFTHEHKAALMTNYSWDKPQREISLIDKLFCVPWKFHLVEVFSKNARIIVDMKYTTQDNCAHKPVSAETKCLVSRNVMNKLNRVQSELTKQGLGLKVFDGFRPLYVEAALVKYGHKYTTYPLNDFGLLYSHQALLDRIPRFPVYYDDLQYLRNNFLDIPPLMPFSNKGALVAVTLVDVHGKELAMPTLFDDRSEQALPGYQNLPEDSISHRELLKSVMLKHGFKQADTWYEFYDDEINEYPHVLYSSYTTSSKLDEEQKDDWARIRELINTLIHIPVYPLALIQRYACMR